MTKMLFSDMNSLAHGIKHKLSKSFKDKIQNDSTNMEDRQFDIDFWKFIEHHFERIEFSSDETRFQLRDLQKMMMLMLHDSDRKATSFNIWGSKIQQLKNTKIPEEIFSEYTDSITLNVRQHIIDTLSPFFTRIQR